MRSRIVLLASLLSACSGVSGDEAARIRSPDNKYEAVVIEDGSGATTLFWYDVCIVAVGSDCTSDDAVVVVYGAGRNESASGVNVRWESEARLVVEYDKAKSVKTPLRPSFGSHGITVDLRPGTVDPSAPPGAMVQRSRAERS